MTHTEPPHDVQDEIKAKARHEYQDARERFHDGAHRLKTETGPTLLKAVEAEFDRHKAGLSSELGGLQDALENASRNSDASSAPIGLAGYGAGLVKDLNSSIEGRSVSELGTSIANYARANPAMFIGGCLLAGLAVSRLVAATPPASQETQGYGSRPSPSGAHRTDTTAGASYQSPEGRNRGDDNVGI